MTPRERSSKEIPRLLTADDIVEDAALTDSHDDRFDHGAIAGRVSELVCAGNPPLNIALYGPYGSGKSGFFALLGEDLQRLDPSAQLVRYDAWKYGGRTLKRNFIDSIARTLEVDEESFARGLHENSEEQRLDLGRWIEANRKSLAIGFIGALSIAATWLFAIAYITMLTRDGLAFREAVTHSVTGAGAVLGIALAALVIGPQVMESANVKISQPAPEDDDQFARHFEALVDHVTKKGERRLVVFIDELDRCAAEDVVSTLIDLKTFLDQKGCIFVVTADRDVLDEALKAVPQVKPIRDEEPYYSTPGAFLDKIFQHQIALPPLRQQALTHFARALVLEHAGLWSDLREAADENRLFDTVIYTLIPAHVQSPRRVKVLLNNYATDVRIAEARGIEWLARASEIAKLTAIRTEFPSVAAHLPNQPRLLSALLERPDSLSPELEKLLAQFAISDGHSADSAHVDGDDSPAGELLGDADTEAAAVQRAAHRLNRQLRAYLAKTRAASIPDPRPDLLYLQGAGAIDGLHNRELGEVIDYASDIDPSSVVSAFEGEASSTVAIAARLLAERSDNEYGPGKANLAEAACRLFEQLDPDDAGSSAPSMAPSVLVAIRADGSRPAMLPGALALGARAANGDLVSAVLDLLDDSESDVGLLGRLVPVLGEIDDDSAARLAGRLGDAYRDIPEPLHRALHTLSASSALRLWMSQVKAIRDVLEKLSTEDDAPPSAVPPATGQAAPAVAVVSNEVESDEELETALERFTSLLNAVTSRDEPSEVLTSLVLRVGQEVDDADIYEYTRQSAEGILPTISAAMLVNDHALIGITHGVPTDWDWWTEKIRTPDSGHSELGLRAVRRVIAAVSSADLDVVAAMPTIVARLVPFLADAAGPRLAGDIEDALAKIDWAGEPGAPPRRRAAYSAAGSLSSLVQEEEVGKLLSADVMRGIGTPPSEELHRNLLAVARDLVPSAASVLDDALDSYQAPPGGEAFALRLQLVARGRFGGTAPASDEILAVVGDPSAPAILEAWLSLQPPVDDARAVLVGGVQPAPTVVETYATGLSSADRTDLWMALEDVEAPISILAATGKAGLGVAAVQRLRERLAEASRQPDRDALVNRMLTFPLDSPALRGETSEVVLELLGSNVAGNVALAAKIVIASGGAGRGFTERMREGFDRVRAQNSKALNKSTRQQLVDLKVMTKPKKSAIERFLRQ